MTACLPARSEGHFEMHSLRELELNRLREMTPAEKLLVSQGLWRDARTLTLVAVRGRHPDWSHEDVVRETRRIMSGDRA